MTGPVCILCDQPCMVNRPGVLFCGACSSTAHRVRTWAHRHGVTRQAAAEHFRRPCEGCGTSMLRDLPNQVRCSTCTGVVSTSQSQPDPGNVDSDWPTCRECGVPVHDRRAVFCRSCRKSANRVYSWACRNGVTYEEARDLFNRACPLCSRPMTVESPAARCCRSCGQTSRGRRALTVARTYGVEVGEAVRLLSVPDCGICGMPLSLVLGKHRHIDHDHATGQVRGVLCHWCNLTLGGAKDRPDILRAAAEYLDDSRR